MARLITIPDSRKPSSSTEVRLWTPGGPGVITNTTRSHVVGSYTSSNGINSGENFNPSDTGGNIYTSSSGFYARVNTSSTSELYTHHFIGANGNSAYNSGGTLQGSSLIGASVYNSAKSSWTKGVKGFVCEVSNDVPKDGSTANDGCGSVNTFRISGVFVDSNGRIRIYDMTAGGTKVFGHTWNTRPSAGWNNMCYYCNSNDQLSMYHLGWVIAFTHKKVCGGGSVNKNCIGSVRYLQPMVAENHGGLYTSAVNKWHIIEGNRRWDERNTHSFLTA
jgi:hypothetical protein